MKLPALWIVAAFAAGIALAGLQPPMLPIQPALWLTFAGAALLAGFGLQLRSRSSSAWVLAIIAWTFLGTAAARLEPLLRPGMSTLRWPAPKQSCFSSETAGRSR